MLLLFCSLLSFGQTDFSIHFGGLKPTGHYGYENNEDCLALYSKYSDYAGTGLGLNAGAKLRFSIPKVKGLGIIGSLDFFYNGLNKENKENIYDSYVEVFPQKDKYYNFTRKCNYPNIMNIPLMVGANYQYDFDENMSLWAEFAFGLNYRIITSHKYKMSYKWDGHDPGDNNWGLEQSFYGRSYKQVYNFKNNFTFGRQIGFGVILAKRFSIGLHYYNLGGKSKQIASELEIEDIDEQTYKGKLYTDKDVINEDIEGGKFNASMLVLRFGIHF